MFIKKNKFEVKNETEKLRTLSSRLIKYILVVLGMGILLVICIAAWIYFSLLSGPGPMEISSFHPFKSEKAKTEYLALEDKMAKKWPVISEERIVETSFGKTFMRISGPIDAPPLVLLPGGSSNSLIWNANIKELSQSYRTYALDNIYDYGRSIYTREMSSGRDYAEWLNELFDTLRLGNNIRIMGYSYGGWVVSQYALYHPERLSHIVFVAPAVTILPLPNDYILRMAASLLPIRYFKEKIMYWVWNDLAQEGERGKMLVEERIDYYETALKCFKFKQPVNPTVLSDMELQALRVPTLYLVGEHETAYNANDAISRLNRINPQIKTKLISGTGHDLLLTHTELVNKVILSFLGDTAVENK
jgi:pimeloyl-ACP methyl ester carboxylesterase